MKQQLEDLVREMRRRGIPYYEAVDEFKKAFLSAVLGANDGNQSRSAKQLGVHRNTLTRTIEAMHIDPREMRPAAQRRPPQAALRAPSEQEGTPYLRATPGGMEVLMNLTARTGLHRLAADLQLMLVQSRSRAAWPHLAQVTYGYAFCVTNHGGRHDRPRIRCCFARGRRLF